MSTSVCIIDVVHMLNWVLWKMFVLQVEAWLVMDDLLCPNTCIDGYRLKGLGLGIFGVDLI